MEYLLSGVSQNLQYTGVKLENNYGFTIERNKSYAIIGENGCGKTTLGKIIEKGWNIATNKIIGDKKSLNIKSIEFSDIHSLTGFSESYYQQRFEASANDNIPTVNDLIGGKMSENRWDELCERLSLRDIRNKRINYLSSGELRKFLIINLFAEIPDILILDNPYIGLDEDSRTLLDELLSMVIKNGTAVILLLCNPNDIPSFTNVVIPMKNKQILESITINDNNQLQIVRNNLYSLFDANFNLAALPHLENPNVDYSVAFELSNCNVSYGDITILSDLSWRVEAGDNWALLGENGAGKSTLLSLVYADNPQGYKNNISIFDRPRGSGESIWDIKRRISYISPEMHLYFNNGEIVASVVASGLSNFTGCFRQPKEAELDTVNCWLQALGISELSQRRFNTLSSGEQRLVLLARTFIKNAPLLILDEPLHGLDSARKKLIAQLIMRRTQYEKSSLIYVTHYKDEIPPCCNKTFRLKKHQIH
ncbi:MAG: ATP-binding cassette domain-containing protein [Muribaculaceae bacterium]|nr:ATP-binding cassette domain-containing protein [Muribaculaceae bacterium]